jgi:hypothetical protein
MSRIERYLNESFYDEFLKEDEMKKIDKMARDAAHQLDWDTAAIFYFCLGVMEDANAHSAYAKCEKIFEDDLKRFK